MPTPKQPKPNKKKRRSRAKQASGLPKGAYRVPPTDDYVLDDKNYTKRTDPKAPVRQPVVVRAVKKANPDLRGIARALVAHAVHETQHEAGVQFGPDPKKCSQGCNYLERTRKAS